MGPVPLPSPSVKTENGRAQHRRSSLANPPKGFAKLQMIGLSRSGREEDTMFCHHCGNQIPNDSRFCHYCGAAQETRDAPASAAPDRMQPVQSQPASPYVSQPPAYPAAGQQPAYGSIQPVNNTPAAGPDDSVSVGLVILSVFIPVFGIIYWPVKAKTRPKCARACGIASLIAWGLSFLAAIAQ